jgi:hypothetical protein
MGSGLGTTRVIHIRNWQRGDPDHVYIGRAGHGLDGYFGNPFRRQATCGRCGQWHEDGGSTLPCHEAWARERLARDSEFRRRVAGLRGKTLACFCEPNPCHGRVLARLADELAVSSE